MDRILPSQLRPKLYLILVFISIMMFFISIEQIKPVVVTIDDFLGLTSCLTPLYWMGLFIAICCAIFAFFDKKLSKDYVFILVLITLGIFMFGPRIFAEANGWNSGAYWFGAIYQDVFSTSNKIDLSSNNALQNYSAWPAIHFISSYLINITGTDYEALIQYMPLLWLLNTIVISYAIGTRLGLSSNNCFILSLMATSAFWVCQYPYSAQMIAYILYLLLIMFIIKLSNKTPEILLLLIIFAGLVLTHGLTTITVIFSSVLIALYQRKTKFVIAFITIFIGWLLFVTPIVFETGFTKFWSQITNIDLLSFTQGAGYVSNASLSGEVGRYIRLFYPLTFAILVIIAMFFFFLQRKDKEIRNKLALCVAWSIGVLLLLVASTGWVNEIDWRIYIYLLIPCSVIIILSFNKRILIIPLVVLFIILHLPAAYHTETFEQTLTTELKGAQFFATNVETTKPVYISRLCAMNRYIQYYNPDTLYSINWVIVSAEDSTTTNIKEATINILNDSEFILNNKSTTDAFIYAYGFDPVEDWLHDNDTNLIYNNMHYQIYKK